MQLEFKRKYLSIKNLAGADLPDFSLLIGRNGIGKTQLLQAIEKGFISVSGITYPEIELYNLNSFKLHDSPKVDGARPSFAARAIEKYLAPSSGLPLVESAKNIFAQTLKDFDLKDGSDERREFEENLKNEIRIPRGSSQYAQEHSNEALSTYFKQINEWVIRPLKNRQSNSARDDPASLIVLSIQLSGKFPHEINRDDILRADCYDGETIANGLNEIFTRYKVGQHAWAHTQGETSQESIQQLMARYRKETQPPWIVLRRKLEQMREASGDPELFNFEFSDPEEDKLTFFRRGPYSFATKLTNRATGESYSAETLSSGETIMMTLLLTSFNRSIGCCQPRLLLLDEVDCVLHPSMISALISGLKSFDGMRVIMATHSVTTVAVCEEDEIFRLVRSQNNFKIGRVTKSEAIEELSEGLATIEKGLKIAISDAAPITILTEGNNAHHLERWASLYFPQEVAILDNLRDITGASQLKVYGQLLSRVKTNSHILIVWDCDAKETAENFKDNAGNPQNVTAFSFPKRENSIASRGIENMYDEDALRPYLDSGKNTFRNGKRKFAEYIHKEGTREHFKHFDDLQSVVKGILERLPAHKRRR